MLFLIFRSSVQCIIYCMSNPSCSAVWWDESLLECNEMEEDSLICDEDKIDSIKVLVDQSQLPPSCKGM